jgi:hypothetical protein
VPAGVFGTIVDTKALLDVIWASLAAGVGGTAAFSLALVGATRFSDMRREGRRVEAATYAVLAGVALAACLGTAVFGVVVIVSK